MSVTAKDAGLSGDLNQPKEKVADSIQSPRTTNTRDIQIAKGKLKTISNRNQNICTSSEPSSPRTANLEYTKTNLKFRNLS